MYTIEQLKKLSESEDKVEFKEAKRNFPFTGGSRTDPKKRRKCFLGYVVALCNEGGGYLVLGMCDKPPRQVVGTHFRKGLIGKLVDDVYSQLHIRVAIEEIYEEKKRVLVCEIPGRPRGKLFKFEEIPLMRTGDSLRTMEDMEVHSVLSEQEPDFSAKVCQDANVDDLDTVAIANMKQAYTRKSGNGAFAGLSDRQALSDLGLLSEKGITYAAIILLGKPESLEIHLPNCKINVEYREKEGSTEYDNRRIFQDAYFKVIDRIWDLVGGRNKNSRYSRGPYIFDIPSLNEDVIRESINNAVAHRDYSKGSEIVVKQSPRKFEVINHGGFPPPITKENVLYSNSTPRNRLLADVLRDTGLVERAGQGVDKIFYSNLKEGKNYPDYSLSDLFQVQLIIPLDVKYVNFSLFIEILENEIGDEDVLNAFDLIALANIRDQREITDSRVLNQISRLIELKAIREDSNGKHLFGKRYDDVLGILETDNDKILLDFILENNEVKMSDLQKLFGNRLTEKQIRYLIHRLIEEGRIIRQGKTKDTVYKINDEK